MNLADLLIALGAVSVATFIPVFAGLFAPRFLSSKGFGGQMPLLAFSSGILFWSFFDWMNDAAQLGINDGLHINYTNLILVLLFGLGLILPFWLERAWPRTARQVLSQASKFVGIGDVIRSSSNLTFEVALIIALGIGFQSLGEGIAIGAQLVRAPAILEAFGGLYPGISYVLHKFLEGFSVGAIGLLLQPLPARRIGIMGAFVGLATILGFFLGIPRIIESTYAFAPAAAVAIYAEVKLVPRFTGTSVKFSTVLALLLGVYALYFAGLFHSG